VPGFAKQASTALVGSGDVFNVNDVVNVTFYGFVYDKETGGLTVDKINDGSLIRLPDGDIVRDDDYRAWTWSANNLTFAWDTTEKSHLTVEVA